MTQPSVLRALDLFCGAGGASVGLARAGFEVTGVDHRPQPHYPYQFIQADALTFPLDQAYDLVWASPPCQAYSLATVRWGDNYPKLIDPIRRRLQRANTIYVIENVIGAQLLSPIMLCGRMFGLPLIRHRLFECNIKLKAPTHKPHGGTVKDKDFVTVAGHGGKGRRALHLWKEAMGIDWMDEYELTQAIPPVYSQFIAEQLIKKHFSQLNPSLVGLR